MIDGINDVHSTMESVDQGCVILLWILAYMGNYPYRYLDKPKKDDTVYTYRSVILFQDILCFEQGHWDLCFPLFEKYPFALKNITFYHHMGHSKMLRIKTTIS